MKAHVFLNISMCLALPITTTMAFAPVVPQIPSSTVLKAASTLPEGLLKTISKPGSGPTLRRGDVATVKYTVYLPNQPPFSRSVSQKVVVADANMIAGWETVIPTMMVGERAIVRIPSSMAYGSTGVPPLIPPNADVELDLEILDSSPPVQMDFDSLGFADPSTPRSASAIAAAYDKVLANKVPERKGFDGWLDKARNYYFFGFFDGETGEAAPWFLRPSITFPIAFAIVGLTFYVALAGGGIRERGGQSKDELDEILLSATAMSQQQQHPMMGLAIVMGIVAGGFVAPDLML